jgi:hypothetical protein
MVAPNLSQRFKLWKEALDGGDRNSVREQLIDMTWNLGVFLAVNEALRIDEERNDGVSRQNGAVWNLFQISFFESMLVRVRALGDGSPLERKERDRTDRSVYSIKSVLTDIECRASELTRGNLVELHGLAYDYRPIQEERRKWLEAHPQGKAHWTPEHLRRDSCEWHIRFDKLAGTNEHARSPEDIIRGDVFKGLKRKIDSAVEEIKIFTNKFIVHHASPDSRREANADDVVVTLRHLLDAHRALCQTAHFIAFHFLGDNLPDLFPVAQFDLWEHIDRPLAKRGDKPSLESKWDEMASQTHRNSLYGIDELMKEMGRDTLGPSQPST